MTYSGSRALAGALISILVSLLLAGCSGQAEQPQSNTEGRPKLALCPASPNCVSTEEQSSIHGMDAPTLKVTPAQAWPAVVAAVVALPRTTLTYEHNYHLRAESHSWLFRFTDDLEIYLDTENNRLAMRSASRLGYSDLGANARRLKNLITELRSQGVVK
ncbi:MAG: DUF1499 domain-containing protein [Oceanicoccus sp.]